MIFIVRMFPEITVKSRPVRARWTKMLADNIRILCRRLHDKTAVVHEWDRIVVDTKVDDKRIEAGAVDILSRTPGIANFSAVRSYDFVDLQGVYERALMTWRDVLVGKTFCVRVRRSGKHDYTSVDAERFVGGGLNQNTEALGVRLKNPDLELHIEIKDDKYYIVEKRLEGVGGFPMGSQEPVMSLISGGFDSTVASYMMQRRGLRTHFCFFNLGGRAHEIAVKEVAYYLWSRYSSTHKVKFITVPFEGVVSEIMENMNASTMGVALKRMMLRAAEKVAARGGINALVTGEAVSQVSSQTISNLALIDSVTNFLVFRPLITMDKPEIIRISREIGAEEFSASIPEYCGVISVKPSSKVKAEKIEEQEQNFNFDVLDQAIAGCQVQSIDEVMENIGEELAIQKVKVLSESHVVIDVRHPAEQEASPMMLERNQVLEIPFYSLDSKFSQLEKEKEYLLYCDKGVMSELHAAHLRDAGHQNVAVYRP